MRVTRDADRDAIAVIRAALRWDDEAVKVIVDNADLLPMINAMAEMFSHGCRRGPNAVSLQLDRYLANVDQWVTARERQERQVAAHRAHIAKTKGQQ